MKPRCPYFGACGGCQLQDISYEEQLERKKSFVLDCLQREGLTDISVRYTFGMDDPWFYRNKIQFPIRAQNNRLQMGYFKARSHEIVNIKECYIQDPFLTESAVIACQVFESRGLTAYDEKTGKGLLRHFVGRSAFNTDEVLLGVVINAKGIPAGFSVADEIKKRERLIHRGLCRHEGYPEITRKRRIVGIVQNVNTSRGNVIMGQENTTLLGIPYMRERLGKYNFSLQLLSFFQVNPIQTVKLYNMVRRFAELKGAEKIIDAYAGIGTIAFWLADKAAEVVGIEERKEAVKDAARNIQLNNLTNVKIEAGLIEKGLPSASDVVVLDPPRGGCSAQALKMVVKAKPKRIIYVSCNPATLARDLKQLVENDYRIEIVQPVDMFPQTEHIEVIVKLVKG